MDSCLSEKSFYGHRVIRVIQLIRLLSYRFIGSGFTLDALPISFACISHRFISLVLLTGAMTWPDHGRSRWPVFMRKTSLFLNPFTLP